jgi:hypothetical protein
VAGIRRKPKGKGKRALYQGWFTDHTGKRRFFTGTASRSETAIQQYQQAYASKEVPRRVPTHPLLYVPRDPARELDKDLQAAAIPKYSREGKVDFHALRLAYINFVLESGASVKEAQALARHASPAMTMNVYGRTRNERLVQTVERVGRWSQSKKTVPEVCPNTLILPLKTKGILKHFKRLWLEKSKCRRGDLNPHAR